MTTMSHPPDTDPNLVEMIERIEKPHNQGDPLLLRDYIFLVLLTVVTPAVLLVLGGLI